MSYIGALMVKGAQRFDVQMAMKSLVPGPRAALFFCAALTTIISMLWIDEPVAALFGGTYHLEILETLLGGIVLVAAELLVLAALVAAAWLCRKADDLSRTLMLACGVSILAYGSNHLLKIVFGRPVPLADPPLPGMPVFHFFGGDNHSSFPSGHMALLAAFAGVLMQTYPGTRPFLPLILCLAGAAMVLGNWHYVSDIIAGAMLGLGAGLAAGRLSQAKVGPDQGQS